MDPAEFDGKWSKFNAGRLHGDSFAIKLKNLPYQNV